MDTANKPFDPAGITVLSYWVPIDRALTGPWTPEEQAQMRADAAAWRAKAAAKAEYLRKRHATLADAHADNPVVSALLEQHAPHEQVNQVCHGCEPNSGGYGYIEYTDWPCPTWETIAKHTPAATALA